MNLYMIPTHTHIHKIFLHIYAIHILWKICCISIHFPVYFYAFEHWQFLLYFISFAIVKNQLAMHIGLFLGSWLGSADLCMYMNWHFKYKPKCYIASFILNASNWGLVSVKKKNGVLEVLSSLVAKMTKYKLHAWMVWCNHRLWTLWEKTEGTFHKVTNIKLLKIPHFQDSVLYANSRMMPKALRDI